MIAAVGIDSHLATLAACAVDELGGAGEAQVFANDRAGHRALAAWLDRQGARDLRIGVEGARGFAYAAVETLLVQGRSIVEVPAASA